ncbi:MAG: biotin--[acetyl-CoA-carboxylase] ligase [Muribaculaceae bacterium]|nr:biotin--[acetyl-CoA-carboxylase] ligase [Muribaculaceae bacterium]
MIIRLPSCPSTNAALAAMDAPAHGTTVACHTQTAGRGQRGNSWEAEPGKNLTFSTLIRPEEAWPPARQFEISMLVALAVAECTDELLEGCPGLRSTVKWPNDIYVGNRKICGILIENTIAGSGIVRSIAGVGLNINQRRFLSDAPNPVSAAMLTGLDYELDPILDKLVDAISDSTLRYFRNPDFPALKQRFMSRLYRFDGKEHPFRLPDGTEIRAEISDVEQDGHLITADGARYAFKEIAYII